MLFRTREAHGFVRPAVTANGAMMAQNWNIDIRSLTAGPLIGR